MAAEPASATAVDDVNPSSVDDTMGAGDEGHQRWGNRVQFLFAAIGSAVGVGNILRFPILVYHHGGLAFMVPYAFALIAMGIPLLRLETGMGQLMQRGSVEGFGKVHRRATGIGLMSTAVSLLVAWYYTALMGWCWVYFFASFKDPLPWAGGIEAAEDYFYKDVLNVTQDLYVGLGPVQWHCALGLLATWTCVFFSLWKGVESLGPILYVTIPLPFFLIFVLIVKGLSLEGAGKGIEFYVGRMDFDAFKDGSIWVNAASQIFFSLSLAQGIMQAYAANNPREYNYVQNSWIIGLTNSGASFFAGFALFSTLGYLSDQIDKPIETIARPSFDLGFIVYPSAIALFSDGIRNIFSIIFFACLLMLGIDSAFSLVEVGIVLATDYSKWCRERRSLVALLLCTAGFLFSLIFATRGGFWILEIVDNYVVRYAVLLIGILECVVFSVHYGLERFSTELEKYCGAVSSGLWYVSIWYLTPIVLSSLLLYNLVLEGEGNTGSLANQPPWSIGIFGWLICMLFPLSLLAYGFFVPTLDSSSPYDAEEKTSLQLSSTVKSDTWEEVDIEVETEENEIEEND